MALFNFNGLSESSGVYVIFNSHNWRLYVGSSMRFRTRWKAGHLGSLKSGKHANKFLQSDFNKCKALLGHDDFLEFHVLENMPGSSREERLAVEERWLAVHFDQGRNCYNHRSEAVSREGCPDSRPRKVRADKGIPRKPLSEAQCRLMSEARKGKPFPGRRLSGPLSEAHKLALSKAGKGRIKTPEERAKLSIANTGKKLSPEAKAKISRANTGRKQSPEEIEKRSKSLRGKIKTPEQRAAIALRMLGNTNGCKNLPEG